MQEAELVSKLPVISSLPVATVEEEAAEPYIVNPDIEIPQKYPGALLVGLILIGIVLIPATSIITNEFSAWYMGRHHKDSRPAIVRLTLLIFCLIVGFGIIYFLYSYTNFFLIPSGQQKSTKKISNTSSKPVKTMYSSTTNTPEKPLPHLLTL